MRKTRSSGWSVGAFALGAVLVNAAPALADFPVIDPTSIAKEIGMTGVLNAINAVLGVMHTVEDGIQTATNLVGNMLGDGKFGSVQQLLQEGFTQEANYTKASAAAQESLTDASNTAMAGFQRSLRSAQIRDEQTPSPTACAAIDGGVSTQAAAVQAYSVAREIAAIQDARGEALPGMPSHLGQAQGVASMANLHNSTYCSADEAAAGLCTVGNTPNADQSATSLFVSGAYSSQAAVNAAKDYATTLIEPVAPAALRGDQLASIEGQEAAVRRRSYNARMSVPSTFMASLIGMQTPSVPLTPVQTTYLQNLGIPAPTNGSMLQVLQIEAERRFSDTGWHATLAGLPPASVEREVALELATTNYLLFQIFRDGLTQTTVSATQLAEDTEHSFMPTVKMPTPSVAAN